MRRIAAIIGVGLGLASLAGLGACGFTPLYADGGATHGLTHIQVNTPRGRVGYLLREDLDDTLGHAEGEAPTYKLDMQLVQTRNAHGLQADATAQRYELDLTVKYTLTEVATGKVAHTGQVVSVISYDSTAQPYAGIAARGDTENRLAQDAATKIELQLAAWLAGHPAA